jgi:hypothetical protein
VNRATACHPEDRHASARELREDIANFLRHRSARALCDAALERLSALEELLALAGSGAPADLARAYRLAAEARFGLTQSLLEHGGEDATQDGMRRCVAASIDLELRQEHADSAAALLREMEPPDPALAARIEGVRARHAARAAEQERLKSMARDLDPTEQSNKRTLPLMVGALVLALIGTAVRTTSSQGRPEALVFAGLIALVLMAAAALALRRRVLTNAFNRRIGTVVVVGMAGSVLHRLLAVRDQTSAAHTLTVDLILFAVVVFSTAVTMLRPMWIAAAVMLAGAGAATLWPAHVAPIFSAVTILAIFAGAMVLARARRPD